MAAQRRVANGRDGAPSGRGPVSQPRSLDLVDKAIIEALQENGREPFRRIAARIGVSEATVRARYERLCRDDILQVTGVTNPLGVGFDAQALVGVKVSGSPEPLADEISRWPEASYVVITAGRFDVIAELVCTDRRHLLDLTNRIRLLDGVASTETLVYLQLLKQLYNWGARVPHDAHEAVRSRRLDGGSQGAEAPASPVPERGK